ncbi:MAG: GldG family protein [Polyangiaceae bacterium]|nr:GldG family protein [Polyangiaceae bacterium]
MASEDTKRKAAAQTGIYVLVLAVIVVLVNVFSAGTSKRWDVTKSERYTLSKGSGRLVQGLKSPIQVDAYVTRGSAQLDAFVRDLTDLLKEYERNGGGNFKFTLIEAKSDEEKAQAKEAGLQEMAGIEASATGEDQATITQGYMGLVLKYGSEKGVIPQLAPGRTEGLEFWITNKIREVRDKADDVKYRIGVVTGKDELKLSDQNLVARQGRNGSPSIESILEQAFPFYKLEEVDLKDGESDIDPELAGLIITQPRKDYTEKELRRVDQFLMRGGKSLVVWASAATLKPQDAGMVADIKLHGLDKLLIGYGIEMKEDVVLDFGASMRLVGRGPAGPMVVRYPAIAHVIDDPRLEGTERLLDTGFAAFFRLDEIALPYPSTLVLQRDKQPADVKLYPVARSTPQATSVTGSSIDLKLKLEWEPKPPMETRVLAAVAEGKLKSAFASGEIQRNDVAPEPSRVLVVASGCFVTNPFSYAGNGPELGGQFAMFGAIGGDPNLQAISQTYAQSYLTQVILSVKNTLDWMSGDTDLIAASAKILSDPNLAYTSVSKPTITEKDDEASLKRKDEEYRSARKKLQGTIQWSLILGLPLFFAGIGILRWRMREGQRGLKRL